MNFFSKYFFAGFILIQSALVFAKPSLESFQSKYNISLAQSEYNRLPGKTYIENASGYLLVDWINNCNNSWITNQRMMTKFINSHGVGTVSEINYSLNEMSDGKKMDFVLEIKEDAEVVDRHYGKAVKNKNMKVKFIDREKELTFPNDVIFPHKFLEDIVKSLKSKHKIINRKVYEGTIPEKFFNISVFFTEKELSIENSLIPKGVINKFREIRMSYYQDNSQTPIFEQTVHLNEQGIASFFRYDYPEYSLILNLEEIKLTSLDCEN
ncbi:MAG: DUF1849 family protein [Pseudomonadota bacterium]|nr:DUF1849 family protein [Pseudomonadota bacterium]